MQNNAPTHAAHFTIASLQKVGFNTERLMIWPASFPDLNPRANFWSILQTKIYRGGKQYISKDDLWMGICDATDNIRADEIQNLTRSVCCMVVWLTSCQTRECL